MTVDIRLYNAAGVRQPLPDGAVREWSVELLERGGCGTFELVLAEELDGQSLPAPPTLDWRVEVWLDGQPIYRGWVEQSEPELQEGQRTWRLTGCGLMGRCASLPVQAVWASPQPTSVSDAFAWVASRALPGSDRLPDLLQVIESGLAPATDRVELSGSARDALDALAELAGDALWGFDVDPSGRDRLYVRARSTAVGYRFRVGREVSYLEDPVDLADVVNAVTLRCGTAQSPNLAYNSSFERPCAPGAGAEGNLLTNPSFENGTTGWTFANGASIKTTGSNPGEYARTGTHMAEVDNVNEEFTSAGVSVVGGGTYLVSLWYCRETTDSDPPRMSVAVEQYVSGAWTTASSEEVTATTRSYQQYAKYVVVDAAATQVRVRVTMTYCRAGGTWEQRAIQVDDVALYNAQFVANEGWESAVCQAAGHTVTQIVNWAHSPLTGAYHGAYCVAAYVAGVSTPPPASNHTVNPAGYDCVLIRSNDERRVSARELVGYALSCRVSAGAGLALRLGLECQTDRGETLYVWSDEIVTTGPLGTWQWAQAAVGSQAYLLTPLHTQSVRPVVELRSNGGYWLDAVDLHEYALTRDYYIEGEQLVVDYRVDNAGAVVPLPQGALPAEAQQSIATYGLRHRTLDVPGIGDLDAATNYAAAYLRRYAVPIRRGRVVLDPCSQAVRLVAYDAAATPTGLVNVAGLVSATVPDQQPVRITYSQSEPGRVRCEVELSNRRPDPALLLAPKPTVAAAAVSTTVRAQGAAPAVYVQDSEPAADVGTIWVYTGA
jgi:hypothetical protein